MWDSDLIDCPRKITVPMLIPLSRGNDAGSGRVELKPFTKDSMESPHNGWDFQQYRKPIVLFQQGVDELLFWMALYQPIQREAQVGDGRRIQDIIDHQPAMPKEMEDVGILERGWALAQGCW
ncbi:hypothetical protein LBMAG53_09230 [Planctomycetota bacterium]|nr:hypothetical protein LBMAG53_09230 [Planctomycetota bacterium]